MDNLKKEDLIFTDTDDKINQNDAVLGTLEGPCADFIDGTRNGRHYSEELWDTVFNDPIVNEYLKPCVKFEIRFLIYPISVKLVIW